MDVFAELEIRWSQTLAAVCIISYTAIGIIFDAVYSSSV